MALLFADSFDHYNAATSKLKWDFVKRVGGLRIESVGRRGTNGVNWSAEGVAKNIGSQTTVIAGAAFFPSATDYLPALNKHFVTQGANLVTSNALLLGFGYQGLTQVGVALAQDGSLHVVRGCALELSAFSSASERVASSSAGVMNFTGWSYLEVKVVFGESPTVTVKVNGVTVLSYSGPNTQDGLPDQATQFYIGGGSIGGSAGAGIGWSGMVDDVYLFNATGDTNNDFAGDLAVDFLRPDGDGVVSDSAIMGTSPAATRWQSVDDAVPDLNATYVQFADEDTADSYTHEDLPYTTATVLGVQGLITARKDDAGLVALRHTTRVNDTDFEGPNRYPAGNDYDLFLTPFDESADGPWTLEKVQDSEFGVMRVTP